VTSATSIQAVNAQSADLDVVGLACTTDYSVFSNLFSEAEPFAPILIARWTRRAEIRGWRL